MNSSVRLGLALCVGEEVRLREFELIAQEEVSETSLVALKSWHIHPLGQGPESTRKEPELLSSALPGEQRTVSGEGDRQGSRQERATRPSRLAPSP